MNPRSTLFRLNAKEAQAQSMTPASEPRPFYATRPWLAAALAVGIAAAGSVKLIAQDVPPPPPDAQSTQQDQQQAPDPVAQSQYGGDPSQQQQQPQYPQDQQGQLGQPAPQGQPLPVQQIDQLVAPIALYPDPLLAQTLMAATFPQQVVDAFDWPSAGIASTCTRSRHTCAGSKPGSARVPRADLSCPDRS